MNSFKDTAFYRKKTLNFRGRLVELTAPAVMGILNVSPESFYDGGLYPTEKQLIERAGLHLQEGALLLDLGAASSKPGALGLNPEAELSRLIPNLRAIKKHFPEALLSVDTFSPEVAYAAINEGADLINDISGSIILNNTNNKLNLSNTPYVCMHMRGNPLNMQQLCDYDNFILDLLDYFAEKINISTKLGIRDTIIDPGFGFSKTREQNFELLSRLSAFSILSVPVMVGVSRKSMIWKTLRCSAAEALNGTTALHIVALQNGSDILRVHDVKEATEAITLFKKLQTNTPK